MSLAPQRPNFVLVWIGIILLTFSLISNFLAKSATDADFTAGGRAGVARSLILEDSRPLPNFFTPESRLAEEASFEPQESQLEPFSLPFENQILAPLAKDDISSTLEESVVFPVELLEPAVEEKLRSADRVGVGTKLPSPASSNHSLEQNTTSRFNESSLVDGSSSGSGDSLKSTYGGSGRNLNLGQQRLRKALETSGPGVAVKAKLMKASNRNTVIVSFFVSHPNATEKLQSRLRGRELSPKVIAMAREYMRAVAETHRSESEEDFELEEDAQNELEESALRRELIRKLRQRPGGIEIIAEMTPAQLRELANKLDARSHKLRALVN